jgi:hypothetical protein
MQCNIESPEYVCSDFAGKSLTLYRNIRKADFFQGLDTNTTGSCTYYLYLKLTLWVIQDTIGIYVICGLFDSPLPHFSKEEI